MVQLPAVYLSHWPRIAKGLGFKDLGFRVQEFRALGLSVWESRVQGLGI